MKNIDKNPSRCSWSEGRFCGLFRTVPAHRFGNLIKCYLFIPYDRVNNKFFTIQFFFNFVSNWNFAHLSCFGFLERKDIFSSVRKWGRKKKFKIKNLFLIVLKNDNIMADNEFGEEIFLLYWTSWIEENQQNWTIFCEVNNWDVLRIDAIIYEIAQLQLVFHF